MLKSTNKNSFYLGAITGMAMLLLAILLFFGLSNIDWGQFALGSPEPVMPSYCPDMKCFKEKALECQKTFYLIQEDLQQITSSTEVSISGKEGQKCKITVELKEIILNGEEPQNEAEAKILNSLNQFFKTLNGQKAECLLDREEITNTDFSNTSFLFKENCSGTLKENLLKIDQKINEIIEAGGN